MNARRMLCVAALGIGLAAGCDTTDTGSTHTMVYYGVGVYDPWYYHGDYDDHRHHHDGDIIINPPPGGGDSGLRPSHPIADGPGGGSRPSVSPRPSIPSTPRPAARGGGRRR